MRDNKAKFEVSTHPGRAPLAAQDAGKALIVFIEPKIPGGCVGCKAQRFGMDGKWVGATKGASYFTLQVEAGEHHFCATGPTIKSIAIRSFDVKAGVTYYLQGEIASRVESEEQRASEVDPGGDRNHLPFSLSLLPDDNAAFMLKTLELAEFKQK